MKGNVSHVVWKENYFKSSVNYTASEDVRAQIYSPDNGEKISELTFEKNVFVGGSFAVKIASDLGVTRFNHVFFNENNFFNYANVGVELTDGVHVDIKGNYFESEQGMSINLVNADSSIFIENNQFKLLGTSSATCVRIKDHSTRNDQGEVLLYNNVMRTDQGIGIWLDNSDKVKIYHNSVYTANNTTSYTMSIENCDSIEVMNNIFINDGTFQVIYWNNAGTETVIDNNAYYSTGSNTFSYNLNQIENLSSWQSITGQDANSVFTNVEFSDDIELDLKCTMEAVLRLSAYISGFDAFNDFNGITRSSAPPPFLGAKELQVPSDNLIEVSGFVRNDLDTIKMGMVFIYGDTSSTRKELDLLGSTSINGANGSFLIQQVPAVPFYIKIVPNSSLYPDYLISYHDSSLRIENSNAIDPDDCYGISHDAIVRKKEPFVFDGKGVITGKVVQNNSGTSKTYGTDPIPGLDVILDKIPPSKTVAVTQTDNYGDYQFSGLPEGIYVVTIDYNGLKTDTLYEVDVTGNDTVHTELDYCVDTTTQILGCYPSVVSVQEEVAFKGIVSPNPFMNVLTIRAEEKIDRIEIYSVSGQLVKLENMNSTNVSIRTEDFERGLYLVKIYQGTSVTTQRVVK